MGVRISVGCFLFPSVWGGGVSAVGGRVGGIVVFPFLVPVPVPWDLFPFPFV